MYRVLFLILIIVSCRDKERREDIVFSASDELHRLVLYEKNKEFEILHNGINTEKGNYSFENNKIYLTYTDTTLKFTDKNGKKKMANDILPQVIQIDQNNIRSIDRGGFCAIVGINKLY